MMYLYIKIHNVTGLKYLGKTESRDPHKYKGSGKYWNSHLKKHGNDCSTQILLATDDKDEFKETALFFSRLWNIVESRDWANLMFETGSGFDSKTAREIANRRVADGTNPLCGGEIQRKTNKRRVEEGTHPFKDTEFQKTMNRRANGAGGRKALENQTHNFIGGSIQRGLVRSGRHHLLNTVSCIDKKGNAKRVSKELYTSQTGPKEEWEYVHFRSKEARARI